MSVEMDAGMGKGLGVGVGVGNDVGMGTEHWHVGADHSLKVVVGLRRSQPRMVHAAAASEEVLAVQRARCPCWEGGGSAKAVLGRLAGERHDMYITLS